MNIKKISLYAALGANIVATIYFWWASSGDVFAENPMLALGRLSGLLLALAALLQVLLIGRAPWLGKVFGFDRLVVFHRLNGYLIGITLAAHPAFLSLAYGKMTGNSFWTQIFSFAKNFDDVAAATAAFALFVLIIILSAAPIRRILKYEFWYRIHLLVYAAIALAFPHQAEIGGDLAGGGIFFLYWYALYAFVFGNLLWFRFAKPVYLFFKYRFVVKFTDMETPDSYSIYIGGRDMDKFRFLPGQFFKMRFLAKGFWMEEHPFSASARPNGDYIRVTVKMLGDFTDKVKSIKPGTRVILDGPHGLFTAQSAKKDKILLVAGGSGITPIFPLITEFIGKGKDVALIYGSRSASSVIFKKDIDFLSEKYGFPAHYVITGNSGQGRRIDESLILRLAPDAAEREAYVCGPEPMMDSIAKILRSLGVRDADIHREKFYF